MDQADNERMTRVGPGTPMGNLLRRYWHVVGTEAELAEDPVRHVRILGEELTLFRSASGEYGLIDDRCPHRCMSLEYGIPESCGLRCAYHGWVFDTKGNCVEQPFEEIAHPENRYKDEIKIKAYPCQALGGLVFAYMGPAPAPLLPRWDVLVREDLERAIDVFTLPCNWVQCMDNSADPVHFEFLHARFGNYEHKKLGNEAKMFPARHMKIAFDVFKYGLYKRRLLEGEPETADDWVTGHPLLFPNILAQGGQHAPSLQIRIPIDDTHTIQLVYRTQQKKKDAGPQTLVPVTHREIYDKKGKLIGTTIPNQDLLAWVAQGPISDRTREHLATSDRGVVLYHKMLFEEMERVEQGLDPLGTVRDPRENEPMIVLAREGKPLEAFQSRYGSSFEASRQLTPAK